MGIFSRIVSAITGKGSGGNSSGGTNVSRTATSAGSFGAGTNRVNTENSNTNTNSKTNTNTNTKTNTNSKTSTNSSRGSLSNVVNNIINNNRSQAYYVTHDEQGRPQGTILTETQFKNDPVMPRYYGGSYDAYVKAQGQKSQSTQNAVDRTNKQRQEAGLSSNWTAEDVRAHNMVLNNMAMSGTGPLTKEDQLGVSDRYDEAALDFINSTEPNEFNWGQKKAVDAYMSGVNGHLTWGQAKAKNPLLTDKALMQYYGDEIVSEFQNNNPGSIAGPSEESVIAQLESQAKAAHALKLKSSPGYIAKDYDEYVDLVNQGIIAPRIRMDTTGKQVKIPYSTSREDYNTYLQNKYADNGDDYYNRSYSEMANYDPKFWAGDPEAVDADGNPVDTGTYLWLLNNPLTRTLMQGISASGELSGIGPTLQQIMKDPSAGGYGLYSEADVANMYAGHILANDDLGAMLENDPVLLNAILTQAYTPRLDPNNPVTYDVPMVTNPDGTKTRDLDKGVSGTLNLAESYKTPAQLAAELVEDPSSIAGMTNLQLLAAANMLNNQNTETPEDSEESNNKRSGPGGSGRSDYGGGSMPTGGNPETTDTLYSMPEVGNYAAQIILNRMLPTGYNYDYNKRLDKRLADIAAAEQSYKGSVLPSVERTYQDQAANTMANLVAALRANRASGLTSGASRGAQAASDVQAVQAASKENSESLNKLINENLASFLTQLAGKRATAGNDTASELQGYASPMMTALGEVLAQYNYGSAAAQVNNGGLRRMQSYLV